eukprot:UN24718
MKMMRLEEEKMLRDLKWNEKDCPIYEKHKSKCRKQNCTFHGALRKLEDMWKRNNIEEYLQKLVDVYVRDMEEIGVQVLGVKNKKKHSCVEEFVYAMIEEEKLFVNKNYIVSGQKNLIKEVKKREDRCINLSFCTGDLGTEYLIESKAFISTLNPVKTYLIPKQNQSPYVPKIIAFFEMEETITPFEKLVYFYLLNRSRINKEAFTHRKRQKNFQKNNNYALSSNKTKKDADKSKLFWSLKLRTSLLCCRYR